MSNAKANWAELSESPLKDAAADHANNVVGKGSKSDAWFRTAVAYFDAHVEDEDMDWRDEQEESEQHLADRETAERAEARLKIVSDTLIPAGLEMDAALLHKVAMTTAYFSSNRSIEGRAMWKSACERYDNAVAWYNAIVAHLDTMS